MATKAVAPAPDPEWVKVCEDLAAKIEQCSSALVDAEAALANATLAAELDSGAVRRGSPRGRHRAAGGRADTGPAGAGAAARGEPRRGPGIQAASPMKPAMRRMQPAVTSG